MMGNRRARNSSVLFLRCGAAAAAALLFLLSASSSSPVRAQLFDDAELERCVLYINLADENEDNFLDESDFLRLIERFAMNLNCATAYENGTEFTLTETQLDKFMELACPCLALDELEASCCAPSEDQKIDVQVIAKGWEALSDAEKVEPMLLCGHAENLVSDFNCTVNTEDTISPQTQMPSQQPSDEPTTLAPSEHPSNEPTTLAPSEHPSNEPSQAPSEHLSNEPSPPPSVKPSNEPIPAPTKEPSKEPSDEPTPAPSDKPTTIGDEFPPRFTAFPVHNLVLEDPPTSSPTRGPTEPPTKEPTEAPLRDPTARPTTRPTQAPKENTISTGFPTLNLVAATPSPTTESLDEIETCVEAMKDADDGNKVLSSDEYAEFLQKLSGCSDLTSQSLQQFGAFQTLVCACSTFRGEFPSCCQSNSQIDISAAYKSQQDRSDEETRLVEFMCTTSANVLPPEGECDGITRTTPAPVDRPLATGYPTLNLRVEPPSSTAAPTFIGETTPAPVDRPLATGYPTLNLRMEPPSSTAAPTFIGETTPAPVDLPLATGYPTLNLKVEPPSSTTAPTFIGDEFPPSSPGPDVETDEACLAALVQANTDGDTALTQIEYLAFTQILANCPSISRLSLVQYGLFLTYSVPRSTIDIAAAYQTEDERSQVDSIRLVSFCTAHRLSTTFDRCRAPPPTDSPVKAPSSPAPTVVGDELPSPPSPTGGNPPVEAPSRPTDPFAEVCLQAMKDADSRGNGVLSSDEYTVFLRYLSGCPELILDEQQFGAFQTLVCACSTFAGEFPSCCTSKAQIDISVAYKNQQDLSDEDMRLIAFICLTSANVISGDGECVTAPAPVGLPIATGFPQLNLEEEPTAVPTIVGAPAPGGLPIATGFPQLNVEEVPTAVPTIVGDEFPPTSPVTSPSETQIPTASPVTNAPVTQAPVPLPPINEDPPTRETEAPTVISDEFPPTGNNPIATGFPAQNLVDPDFGLCIENLLTANSESNDFDGNTLLDRNEYLSFIVLQSSCDLITSLSQAQTDAFRLIACNCLELENTSQSCCSSRNARVSINGAALPPDSRSQDQEDALREVCSITASVIPTTCAPPPTTPAPTLPPAPAPSGLAVTSEPVRRPVTSEPTRRPLGTPERTQSPIAPSAAPARPLATVQPTQRAIELQTSSPTATPTTPPPPTFDPRVETERPIEVVTTAAPGTTEANLPTEAPRVTKVETLSPSSLPPVPNVPDPTESPVVPPTFELSSSCISAILASDVDSNGFLSESEYIGFVQILSQCGKISVLSQDLKNAYTDLRISGCLFAPQERLFECWTNSQLGIYVDPASKSAGLRTSSQTNLLAEICQVTNDATPDECVRPPTIAPTIPLQAGDLDYYDFEFCTEQLLSADQSDDEVLDQTEYMEFLRDYGQCPELPFLNIGQQAVFLTLASECSEANCALPGNAKLNISGAAISGNDRTTKQFSRLLRICNTAIGLTQGDKCVKPPEMPPPELGCASSLVASDINSDGSLDKEEYLSFMRREYSECAQLSSLSLVQNVVWHILACSCILEPGAGIDCCFFSPPKVDISGAGLPADEMSDEESIYISSICRASNATVEVGCQETLLTPAPSQKSQGERFSSSAPSPAPSKNGVRMSRSSYMQPDFALLAILCVSVTASIFWV